MDFHDRLDITDLSWSPDGHYLCSASVDCRVLIWAIGEEAPIRELEGHNAWVNAVDWDPCGTVCEMICLSLKIFE